MLVVAALAVANPRLAWSNPAPTSWTDGQAAVAVLGQTSFTDADPNSGGIGASSLGGPTNICSDTAHGKVYVMDYNNHRVLRYDVANAITTGAAAEVVLGQPDFTSSSPGITASLMTRPEACAVSPAGTLFVADAVSRVLRFDSAHLKTSGAAADGVLGAPDFTTPGPSGATASSLGGSYVYGIALSSTGALFASDRSNRRILRFDNAAAKANGAAADGVLGQVDFVTGNLATTSATSINTPHGLTFDASDNLYVVDSGNARVLRFDNAPAKANGAAADGVLGATDFTTVGAGTTTASTFKNPFYSVGVGPDGALYVGDFAQGRMLVFNSPATKANGASADHVLGAPDFTTAGSGVSATSLGYVLGLGFSTTGYFFVGDYSNNRVMVYRNVALVVAAPDAPAITTATAGDAQATIEFTAPVLDGNSAITGYTVVSDPAGGIDASAGTTGLSHVVTGLSNGTAYTFTVTATNVHGTSAPSAASSSVTPAGLPGAPSDAFATVSNGTEATVTFAAPSSNGGRAITGYTVASDPAGGTDSNAGSTALSHVVTGLTSGTAYTFTVIATTSVGPSPASPQSNSVTPTAAPGAPTSVVAEALGHDQATVTFAAPISNGGSAITGFTVVSDPAGGVDSNAGTTALTHTITGLTGGTAYTFTVTASNATGTSEPSAASNGVTPAPIPVAGTPGAPSDVVAKLTGEGQATITFIAPASDGGSAITGYTVSSSPAGGIDTNAGTTALSHTVTGLTKGIAYTFTVIATNAVGASAPSPKSNKITEPLPAASDAGTAAAPAPDKSPAPIAATPAPTAATPAAAPTPDVNGGCSCRVGPTSGSSPSGFLGTVALAALVLAARSRRRSSRASSAT